MGAQDTIPAPIGQSGLAGRRPKSQQARRRNHRAMHSGKQQTALALASLAGVRQQADRQSARSLVSRRGRVRKTRRCQQAD